MNSSDRFNRKRRRPKPRNCGRRKKLFLRPHVLKFLMVTVPPLATKVAELVLEIIKLFRN